MSTVAHFDDTAYVSAHGRKPRGHGSWFFDAMSGANRPGGTVAAPHRTYSEAKAFVRRLWPQVTKWRVLP